MSQHTPDPDRDTVRGLRKALHLAGPACQDGAAAAVFMPADVFEDEADAVRRAREKQAKTVCFSCPARAACLAYALAIVPDEGIWAGLTAAQLHDRAVGVRRAAAGLEATA
ncbi:WhiB family transcriptional regulator [Nonomuraea longicatena]|uniref:4Fe-4S Wbl-type domain-containing protein n=1 Tax=Nonomuraea longicatena TaxID=83682 RepID=A0ABP4BB04_9ACTN